MELHESNLWESTTIAGTSFNSPLNLYYTSDMCDEPDEFKNLFDINNDAYSERLNYMLRSEGDFATFTEKATKMKIMARKYAELINKSTVHALIGDRSAYPALNIQADNAGRLMMVSSSSLPVGMVRRSGQTSIPSYPYSNPLLSRFRHVGVQLVGIIAEYNAAHGGMLSDEIVYYYLKKK